MKLFLQPQIYINMVNTSDLKVTTLVPENYIDRVNVGSTVKIIFPDINDSLISKINVASKVIVILTAAHFKLKLKTAIYKFFI